MARLVVELTDRCNLSCGHCPSGRHGGRAELAVALFERVLAQVRPCGIEHISFTGGEPTLHSRFADLLTMTADTGLDFSLVTNGWSLPKHLHTLLPLRERLRMITFSLDGADEATHDTLRGRGSFRRVLHSVSTCVLHGLPFTFSMSLTRNNYSEADALVSLGAGLGALGVRFGHLMSDPNPAAAGLELSPQERKRLDAELLELQARSELPVGFAPGGYTQELSPCSPLQGDEYNLHWDGSLGLCCHLSGFAGSQDAIGGDLNRISLGEALHQLHLIRDELISEKQRLRDAGNWRDDDHFPCWYCARRFGAVEWIREQPEHPWFEVFSNALKQPMDPAADPARESAVKCAPVRQRGPVKTPSASQ